MTECEDIVEDDRVKHNTEDEEEICFLYEGETETVCTISLQKSFYLPIRMALKKIPIVRDDCTGTSRHIHHNACVNFSEFNVEYIYF